MKSVVSKLFIAGVFLALAGCTAKTPFTPTFSPTSSQMNSHIDARAVTETLKAARVVVKVQSCVSGAGNATFTAKGTAKGRVRGTFVVSGAWNFYSGGGTTFWTFAETFKIKGKHPTTGTITGSSSDAIATCKTFGPVNNGSDLNYHLGSKSGSATTILIKNGSTLLQKLR